MFVDSVSFGTMNGGSLSGLVAFIIELTGDIATEEELADLLIGLRRHEKGVIRSVILRGEFSHENADDLMTLARSLTNRKYQVYAQCDGKTYFQWFKNCVGVAVSTDAIEPLGFDVNEIWYRIEEDGAPEMTVPDMVKQPMLYVVPGPGVTAEGILRFVRNARNHWLVHLESKLEVFEMVAVGNEV